MAVGFGRMGRAAARGIAVVAIVAVTVGVSAWAGGAGASESVETASGGAAASGSAGTASGGAASAEVLAGVELVASVSVASSSGDASASATAPAPAPATASATGAAGVGDASARELDAARVFGATGATAVAFAADARGLAVSARDWVRVETRAGLDDAAAVLERHLSAVLPTLDGSSRLAADLSELTTAITAVRTEMMTRARTVLDAETPNADPAVRDALRGAVEQHATDAPATRDTIAALSDLVTKTRAAQDSQAAYVAEQARLAAEAAAKAAAEKAAAEAAAADESARMARGSDVSESTSSSGTGGSASSSGFIPVTGTLRMQDGAGHYFLCPLPLYQGSFDFFPPPGCTWE